MKKSFINLVLIITMMLTLSSCYSNTVIVGKGAQSDVKIKRMNHYILYGFAPVGLADPKAMAGGALDYDVTITHTFVDCFISVITLGFYTPTSTIVKK